MSYKINTGLSGDLFSLAISRSYQSLMKHMECLSSGLRINRASDDPAGLVISETLRGRIASLNQEIDNISQMIRKYETAEGTVGQLQSIVNDLRVQAVGAANTGVNSEEMTEACQDAANQAVTTFNYIVDSASYNGKPLFGEEGVADIESLANLDFSTPEAIRESVESIEKTAAELESAAGRIGAEEKYQLQAERSNLEVTVGNLTAAESQIRDADMALEMVGRVRDEMTLRVGMALLAHSYVSGQSVLSLMKSR